MESKLHQGYVRDCWGVQDNLQAQVKEVVRNDKKGVHHESIDEIYGICAIILTFETLAVRSLVLMTMRL